MSFLPPLNFKKWIDENRSLLKPPVGNKMVWKDRDFIVMVVGGPNTRDDFHYNEGEEFFYQLEGDITVRIINSQGKFEDIPIREGDIFLLPPNTPQSPQRPANTVGLVIERRRRPGEVDGLSWYCRQCSEKLYEARLELTNIEVQLKEAFEFYYSNPKHYTCKKCGAINAKN
jgi:3-hydroxyanthranilate 3,4-dioxygenase